MKSIKFYLLIIIFSSIQSCKFKHEDIESRANEKIRNYILNEWNLKRDYKPLMFSTLNPIKAQDSVDYFSTHIPYKKIKYCKLHKYKITVLARCGHQELELSTLFYFDENLKIVMVKYY